MARGRGKGSDDDASNWDMGKALQNQAEMDAATVEPEWLVLAQDSLTPRQFEGFNFEEKQRFAGRNGRVMTVTEHKNRRGEITSYTVSVEKKNPKYTGGRKGAGKRKFI